MRLGLLKHLVLLILFFCLLTKAYAYDEPKETAGVTGNYWGMQVGSTNLNSPDEYLMNDNGNLVLVRPSNNGFGTRFFWGYRFLTYVALEGGYGYYSPSTYNIPEGHSPELRIQALDLEGKGILPLYWGFDVYVKGGAALVFYKQGGMLVPNPQGGTDGANGFTMRPIFGIGMSYTVTPNMTVDVSATRIMKGSVVPNSNFISIGLSYHMVDLYCGQFLC